MSYICLIANQNGIAVSGDSRLTFQPEQLHLHIDHAQKVFSDQEQGMVWACCGLMVFAGINYYMMSDHILRQSYRSMSSRLNQITGALTRATAAQHWLTRKDSVFTMLIGSIKKGEVSVQVLDVVNGKAKLKTLPTPVLVQSGWEARLHQPKPPVSDYADESIDKLVKRAKDRCLWAVRKDGRLALEDEKHIQTVGGNVRIAFIENKNK
jgi:hypothetical protein